MAKILIDAANAIPLGAFRFDNKVRVLSITSMLKAMDRKPIT